MNARWLVAVATLGAWLAGMTALQAADTWPVAKSALENGSLADPALEAPIERVVQFGTATGAMMIWPNTLTFDKNQLYKLVINNPSNMTHYVSVPEFAAAVQTKKLTVEGGEVTRSSNPWRHILPSSADVTEEIMLSPGGKLEWLFVAEHAGDFGIACAVPGHAKAGMAGKVRIES